MPSNDAIKELKIEVTADTTRAIQSLDNLIQKMSGMTSSSTKVGSGLSKVTDAIKKAVSASGKAKSSSEKVVSSSEKVAKAQEKTKKSSKDLTNQLGKLKEATRGLSKEQDESASSTQKNSTAWSKLIKSIGRIAFYRAIRELVKKVTDAFREGIDNLYEWDRAFGDGTFKQSMDTIATSLTYLHNAIGTLVAPLIKTLAPVIDAVIDKVVDGINYINKFVSSLTGKGWTKAIKKQVEYKEAAEGTAKALQAMLMGFDEINNITTPSDSSSDTSSNVDGMFQLMPQEAEKSIKLTEFAKSVSDFVSTVSSSIDGLKKSFKSLYTYIKNKFGTFLSEYIKGTWKGTFKILEGLVQGLSGILQIFIGSFTGDNTMMLNGLIDTIVGIEKLAVGVLQTIGNGIVALVASPFSLLAKAMDWLIDKTIALGASMARLIGDNQMASYFDNLRANAYSFEDTVMKGLTNALTGINTWAEEAYTKISELETNAKNAAAAFGEAGRLAGDSYWNSFASAARAAAARDGGLNFVTTTTNTQGVQSKLVNRVAVMANGGYASQGSLFLAGEVPGQAEMLGNINGKTGVASGAEITGIADAVYATGDTNSQLLRQLINAVKGQNLTISPSASLGRVVAQSNKMYKAVTG